MAAADVPICAARPGKSTPTCTVPAGRVQIETGLADWSLQKDDGARASVLAIGETTIKYGLANRLDIEVDVTPWLRVASRAGAARGSASGFGDLVIGFKQQLSSPDAPVQLAMLPFVKAPTAKHTLGNGRWEAGLLVPVQFAIPRTQLSVGLTPEIDWVGDADGRGHHASMVQVVGVSTQASEKLSLSADLWSQWDWDPGGTKRQASADASIAYLASKELQLDAGANFGLNSQTADVELYTGISMRF